jgi:hypothetical protein
MMPTTAQRNAVYDALKGDIDLMVTDLVPSFLQDEVTQQITCSRVLKLVDDALAAYEKTLLPTEKPS